MLPSLKSLAWQYTPTGLLASHFLRFWNHPQPQIWPTPPESKSRPHCLSGYDHRVYSQNGEDGLIRHIMSQIASPARTFVEFGFGLRENNCLRLMLHEGYRGLYMDGFAPAVRVFNECVRRSKLDGVRAACEYLTIDNIDATMIRHGFGREVDILSIDVDGVDYWLWEATKSIVPRLVIVEYNSSFGPEDSVTVPYEPSFDRNTKGARGHYHGASITALTSLARRKGYALIGADRSGSNAFFVRRDLLNNVLRETTPASAHQWSSHLEDTGENPLAVRKTLLSMPLVNID
jgi:hypothetical protein